MENLVEGLSVYLHGSFILAYVAAYFGGVLMSLTPCMYPMVPITIAFIGAHSSGSKVKSLTLSIVYVLGMSVTYTILAAVAALTGKLFGQIQTNPWTLFIVANICILMGLSMLEVFVLPIRVPGFLAKAQPKKRGIAGSFLIGAISGLVVGPCTTPALAVLLSFVATSQNIVFGMSLFFIFAFGMGTLLIAVGTFAGLLTSLPKSGMWMTKVSHICGWILLAVGEYFLIQAGMVWL
ncbi:MAG: cytochrome c biogenesis protein CcdA [Syntrophales bacterium]